MPVLAGWLTGEQVPQEAIEQTLAAMGEVLAQHGGEPARTVLPGAGLIAFSDTAYAMQQNDDPPLLDWVPERRTLVYRRPLSGLHPLYYMTDWPAQGNLLFASEMRALFALGAPRRLHLAALDALLRYGFIPAPWTIFKDIQVVPAGSILRWQRAKTVLNQAIDYHLAEPLEAVPSLDQLHALLDEASAHQLPPHEHIAALVSNRNNAAALAALLAAQHTPAPFPIIALGYTKSTSSHTWRSVERVAEVCDRQLMLIRALDPLEFWTATLAAIETPALHTCPLLLHQLFHTTATQTQARVVINGVGAHAILGAPAIQQVIKNAAETQTSDLLARYREMLLSPSKLPSDTMLWSPEAAQALRAQEPWEETLHARKLARHASQFADLRDGLHYLDLHLRLPDYLIHIPHHLSTFDRMALRSPYLNAKVMDTLTRLPATLDDGTPRERVLTSLVRRYIPARPDDFTPFSGRIAQESVLLEARNSDLLRQMLSPEQLRATGLFNPQAITSRYTPGLKTIPRELLLVFTTQLLCELFKVEGWS